MSWIRSCLVAVTLQALVACAVVQKPPEPSPPPVPQAPTPAEEPAPAPVVLPRPVPPAATKPTPAKTAKPTAAKPARSGTEGEEWVLSTDKPLPAPRSNTATTPLAPGWLQSCSNRQQVGNTIQCDANSLLAAPSAKVQVYVRDPALARDTPSGRIQLRTTLPLLYRFFVIN